MKDLPTAPKIRATSAYVASGRSFPLAHADGSDRKQYRILLFDSSAINRAALRRMLNNPDYVFLEAGSTWEALSAVSSQPVDLVLTDSRTLEGSGSALFGVLRSYFRTRSVPVLMFSDRSTSRNEMLHLLSGADEFLTWPLNPRALCARVEAALQKQPALASADDLESVLLSLAQAVEARDQATGQHCQRVALICSTLGGAMGLSETEITTLQRGAFLHDIGKITVPDEILFKRGPLSPEEWTVMKDHTTCGELICAGMKSLHSVLPIIRNHHERWDGGGYPDGLKGSEIPLLARVIQVADIYDALTTDRPYKQAFSPEYALQILTEEAQAGWRDPGVVEAFCAVFPMLKNIDLCSSSSLMALGLTLGTTTNQLPAFTETSTSDERLKRAM